MAISINSKELETLLDITPADQNIMLAGKHGIGKSEILTKYFQAKGIKVVSLFLGQMSDPGDLIGLPNKNEKNGNTEFMPPYWFPTDNTPIVLFLDELNRARPEILQTIMDLALNKKLAGRYLPEGSRIISAVNVGEEYQLTDLDPALVSRFNIYNFCPTVSEWLLWAETQKLDSRVINFIQEYPDMLDGADKSKEYGLEKYPDRRAWKRVSDMIKEVKELNDFYRKAVSGIIGNKAGTMFFENVKSNKLPSAKQILTEFDKYSHIIENLELHNLSIVNETLFRFMETGMKTKAVKDSVITNLPKYLKMLKSTGKSEAYAHWSSLFMSSTYPNSVFFIISNIKDVYTDIQDFISKI